MTVSIEVKCISCGHKRYVSVGEVPRGEQPLCDRCYMPMVPVSVSSHQKKQKK